MGHIVFAQLTLGTVQDMMRKSFLSPKSQALNTQSRSDPNCYNKQTPSVPITSSTGPYGMDKYNENSEEEQLIKDLSS